MSSIPLTTHQIWAQYHRCPVQRQAYLTLMAEIHRNVLIAKDNQDFDLGWYPAIDRFILQLLLFGYAVFKRASKRGSPPIVMSGPDITLRGDSPYGDKWKLVSVSGVVGVRDTTEWALVIFCLPHLDASGRTVMTSPGADAYDESVQRCRLIERMHSRDSFNSKPGGFTSSSAKPGAIDAAMGPMEMNAMAGNMAGNLGVSARGNYRAAELAAVERLKAQQSYTETARQAICSNTHFNGQVGMAGVLPGPKQVKHDEFVTSEGTLFTEARHLKGTENLMPILESYATTIMMLWCAPPQSIGKTGGATERLGSSGILASRAIQTHEDRVIRLRRILNTLLEDGAHEFAPMRHQTVLSLPSLQQIEGVLKPEYALQLYAAATNVQEYCFDVKAIREHRDELNGMHAGAGTGSGSLVQKTRSRPRETEAKKHERSKRKFAQLQT